MSQIAVEEKDAGSSNPSALSSHPLLRLGFRPFYLLGAAFAAIGIPAWLLRSYGYSDGLARIDLNWHAHEMVYGFAAAILNLGFHAARPGWIAVSPLHMVQAAIMVIVIIESAIGGRVIPNFTASAVRDSRPVLYVVVYGPYLVNARIDGREG